MQFPVPQFTDIEDKIIIGLSFKQFAIVFGASVFTFIIYTISKNLLATIFTGLITGVPALALVFGKLNGRPLYASVGTFIQFLFGPKIYVYHKEGKENVMDRQTVVVTEKPVIKDEKATVIKLKQLNYVLEQKQAEETRLLGRIQKENSIV